MKRSLFLAAGMSTLLAATLMPGVVSARTPERFGTVNTHGRKVHLERLPSELNRKRMVDVAVQLVGRPIAAYQADALQAGSTMSDSHKQSIRGVLAKRQLAMKSRLESMGATVEFTYTDVFNGFRIRVHANDVPAISRLPGVTAILSVPTHYRDNTNTVPFLGADKTWGRTGLTGKGVVIAIIDSGINYYHLDFGGAGYAAWKADDPTKRDGTFPTAKVIEGWDLVGDDYNADVPGSQPKPDPDPLDCKAADAGTVQHGTHVSGTAAGQGVTADGKTYTGPYNASTLKNVDFRIGPGVAPEAKLMAFRVFGCNGSSNVVTDAIEMAAQADVDVISMSLGSYLGNPGSLDAVASDNASLAGITVVAAAGNEGPSAYVTGSPGVSTRAISVAAVDAVPGFPGATIKMATGSAIDGINANDANLPVSGKIDYFRDDPSTSTDSSTGEGDEALGCFPADYTYNHFHAGQIAVVQRGICPRVDRATAGQTAGAAAVIMVNNATGLPPYENAIGGVTIPFIGVDQAADSRFATDDGKNITIVSAGLIGNPTYRYIPDFSSAGPSRVNSAIKPDITAPGVSVFSADGGTVAQGKTLSGTSMATPAVAGVAALVKQAHPSWSARNIKAAIVGTAAQGRIAGYDMRFAGSGLAQPLRAVDTVAFVYTDPGSSSITFGYEPAGNVPGSSTSFTESRSMTIWNTGSSAITYRLSNDPNTPSRGLVLSMPGSVTVPARSSKSVAVKVTMSAAAAGALPDAAHLHGPSVGVDAYGQLYTTVTTIAGAVIATPTRSGKGLYALRVPWQIVPRGLSRITDIPDTRTPWTASGALLKSTIPVRNYGPHKGVAEVFAWGLTDDKEGFVGMDLRAGGVESVDPHTCDSNASAADRCLVFALNTWGQWSNPTENQFEVDIDTNLDGTADYAVLGTDLYSLIGLYPGVEASAVIDLSSNSLVNLYLGSGSPNGSTMLLPVLASDLGLKAKHTTSFDYQAFSYPYADATASSDLVDAMGTGDTGTGASQSARFDAFDPSISNGQSLKVNKNARKVLPLSIDPARYLPDHGQKGWMVVSLEDANGEFQADFIPVGALPK